MFNYKQEGNIERAIAGHPIGTLVGLIAVDESASSITCRLRDRCYNADTLDH